MNGRDRIHTGLAIFLLGGATCLQGSAQPAETAQQSCMNQSPRILPTDMPEVKKPTVVPRGDNIVIYTAPDGKVWTLHRCGQHYHCRIENLQAACIDLGQDARELGRPPLCAQPQENTWVEIHTVYAPKVRDEGCDKETLNCCVVGKDEPAVVLGYHARVIAGGKPGPIPVIWRLPVAEWSGSNTGPDDFPEGCKPLAARWSFTLGCDLTVSWRQLGLLKHPDPARGLQPAGRLSKDLVRVKP